MVGTRSLAVRLVGWYVALAVLPSVAIATVVFLHLETADRESAVRHLTTAAGSRAAAVRSALEEYRRQARRALAAVPDELDRRFEPDTPSMDGPARSGLVDSDGTAHVPGGAAALATTQVHALRDGEWVLSGEHVLVGVRRPGGGAAVTWVSVARLFGLLAPVPGLGETGRSYLVDATGTIVGAGPGSGETIRIPAEAGGFVDFRGREVLGAWAEAGPWRVVAQMDAAVALRSLWTSAGNALLIGALLFLAVAALIFFAGRRTERAFGHMAVSIGRAAKGDFGTDEFDVAPAGLREVQEAIRDMHRRLAERDGEIMTQRQELFCQRCELERLNTEIVQADRMKSEFVANMSHEVRTPLHSVLALSQVLLDETSGPLSDEQRKQVSIIERGGRSLLWMLGDILDFSKIEAGRMVVQPEPVAPAGVLAGVRESVAPLADEKGLALELNCEGAPRQIRSDPEKLHRVLLNLAHNAIKFTDRGRVTLRALAGEREGVVFEIADTGPGIHRDELQTIFEPFHQVDGSTTRTAGGTGLGLSIVKSLVGLLGGRVAAESELGSGTTFSVVLPASIASRARGGPRPLGAPNDVLVVGATPPSGEAVRSELLAAGFRAGRAVCGRDLQSALDRTGVGAILLDVGLFGNEGMDVFGQLAGRICEEAVPLIGYWVDPGQRRGAFLGAMRLEGGANGEHLLVGPDSPPLPIPDSAQVEDRKRASAWTEELTERGGAPFHEVMRSICKQLDLEVGPGRDPRASGAALVCDPDDDARYSMQLQLERLGYGVETASALASVPAGCDPDLVITESALPDAPDAVAALRDRFHAPIVVLTADARPETAARAREAGAALVEVKPAEPRAFLRRLAPDDSVVEQG